MRRLCAVVALTTIAAVAGGCGGGGSPAKTAVSQELLLSQEFMVTSVGHATPPVTGTEIQLLFAADGTVSGKAGCNSFHTTYTAHGGSLRFGPVASTQMACAPAVMAQEQAVTNALESTRSGVLLHDELRLHDAAGATTLVLQRQ